MSAYFDSQVPELMDFCLKQAQTNAEIDRKKDIKDRKDLYEDDAGDLILENLKANFDAESFKNIQMMIDQSVNIFKRIVNEISIVYSEAPKRIIENETAMERYQEIIDENNLDLLTPSINQYSNGLNHCGLLILPGDKGPEYSILTPDCCTVYQDPYKPNKVIAIVYEALTPVSPGQTQCLYVYWDIYGNHRVYEKQKNGVILELHDDENPEGLNPFVDPANPKQTIIPVVWAHRRIPEFQFWDQTSGRDLVNGSLTVSVLLTYLNYMMKVTGFPVKYVIGKVEATAKQLMDPLNFIKITQMGPDQASIGSIANEFDLKMFWEVVQEKIAVIANNYGIAASSLKWSATPSSGFSLLLQNWGKVEQVKKQIPMYRLFEKELFEKTRIINNAKVYKTAVKPIPDDAELTVDFAEVEFKEDPLLENQKWQTWIDNGIKSPIDWIKQVNPDYDDKKAAQTYEKNLQDRQKTKSRFGGLFGTDNSGSQGQNGQPQGQGQK